MELQVGVKVLLKNREGKYLLVRRSSVKYPEVGVKWDLVGGRIIPGTPLIENLKREVKEETSLSLVGEPRLIAAQDILRMPGRHVVRLSYVGVAEGEVKLDVNENDEHEWLSLGEIKKIEPGAIDIYLAELLDKNLIPD